MTYGTWRTDHAHLLDNGWQLVGDSQEALWRVIGNNTYGISPAVVHDPAEWNGLWRLYRMGEPFPPFMDLTYIAQSTLLRELHDLSETQP